MDLKIQQFWNSARITQRTQFIVNTLTVANYSSDYELL